jgi:hypothetical protein
MMSPDTIRHLKGEGLVPDVTLLVYRLQYIRCSIRTLESTFLEWRTPMAN